MIIVMQNMFKSSKHKSSIIIVIIAVEFSIKTEELISIPQVEQKKYEQEDTTACRLNSNTDNGQRCYHWDV